MDNLLYTPGQLRPVIIGGERDKAVLESVVDNDSDGTNEDPNNDEHSDNGTDNTTCSSRPNDEWSNEVFNAVNESDYRKLETLLENRMNRDIDCMKIDRASHTTKRGNTPLHDAASLGNYEMCKLLLEHGASPSHNNSDKSTPLHKASSVAVCKLLVEHGADINATTSRRQTALHVVANGQIATYLIQQHIEVNAKTIFGQTCLMTAINNNTRSERETIDICKVLLQNNIDESISDDDGMTASDHDNYDRPILDRARTELESESVIYATDEQEIRSVNVYICGEKGAGKTTLYETLQRGRFRSRLSIERYFTDRTIGLWPYILTLPVLQKKDIAVAISQRGRVPGIGCKFSFREFSSKAPYYLIHAMFTQANHHIIIVVYDIRDTKDTCVKKICNWLAQIKASTNPHNNRGKIIIVATHADHPSRPDLNEQQAIHKAAVVLKECKDMFGGTLQFVECEPFVVDARFGRDADINRIRNTLKDMISELKVKIPRMCDVIIKAKNNWLRPNPLHRSALCTASFPVMSRELYIQKVKSAMEGILDTNTVDKHLETATSILNAMDELILVKNQSKPNDMIIVVKPEWLTSTLLVPLFLEEANHRHLIPTKEVFTIDELRGIISSNCGTSEEQTDIVIKLAEYFELLFVCDEDPKTVIIPCRLPEEAPMTPKRDKYACGISFELANKTDIFSPTFFSVLQFQLLNKYRLRGSPYVNLFKCGARINYPNGTGMIWFSGNRKLFILVDLVNDDQTCMNVHRAVTDVERCVNQAIEKCSPGTKITKKYMNRKYLSNGVVINNESLEGVPSYTIEMLADAEARDGLLSENGFCDCVTDILFVGYDLDILKRFGRTCNVIWLPIEIFSGTEGLDTLFEKERVVAGGYLALCDSFELQAKQYESVHALVQRWGKKDNEATVCRFWKIICDMERIDARAHVYRVLQKKLDIVL